MIYLIDRIFNGKREFFRGRSKDGDVLTIADGGAGPLSLIHNAFEFHSEAYANECIAALAAANHTGFMVCEIIGEGPARTIPDRRPEDALPAHSPNHTVREPYWSSDTMVRITNRPPTAPPA